MKTKKINKNKISYNEMMKNKDLDSFREKESELIKEGEK
jgi:hypothetical protein